jgi:hypothetical protein
MIGALFITDKADLLSIPSNASGLVDMSDTYLGETFLFNRKRPDGFSGTDASTKIAEFFTVSDAGNEPGCIKTCQACF